MVHKVNLKDVEVKAILILGQPTKDVQTVTPENALKQEKDTDFYDDLDDTMKEFTDSLGGVDNKDKPLVAESAL
jgi:hypothetical protein